MGYVFRPPETLRVAIPAHDPVETWEGVSLESLSYEQMVLFALDNGFGVPEDGDLHGQNKQEIRESMLKWLEKKLGIDE